MLFRVFNAQERFPISSLRQRPNAIASVRGSEDFPNLKGEVLFYKTERGTLVLAEIEGLPVEEGCEPRFFGFHVHEKGECEPLFDSAGGHYNPKNCPHPAHAGDLPPLLANKNGKAFLCFLTDSFSVGEVVGKAVIVHKLRDDFTSQPSGDSGERIGCGVIVGA